MGGFNDATGTHGFLMIGDVVTAIDAPDAILPEASGINGSGQIVGNFIDAGGAFHAFLEDGDIMIPIVVPGSTITAVNAINAAGQIVGSFRDEDDVAHGFVMDGTDFVTVDVPNAIAPNFTQALGINDLGQIVGWFVDATGTHGFLATPTVVAEPPSLLLLVLGLTALSRWRKASCQNRALVSTSS